MSRSDSRQVSCANAMTRNTSAQFKVRTPESPLWRSMMRPKVFHGTCSITCAKSVLPVFMRYPRSFKPASIANIRITPNRAHYQIPESVSAQSTTPISDLNFPDYRISHPNIDTCITMSTAFRSSCARFSAKQALRRVFGRALSCAGAAHADFVGLESLWRYAWRRYGVFICP